MAEKTKARKLSYERRSACIIKKSQELQILCGIKVGVVILSPDGKLESWPPELTDVKALLDTCKERPGVKTEKRKKDPHSSSRSCQEILVSKLQLLNQREELFKGKEIAGETLVRSKKRKDDSREGCLEILNSKLELLKKREMVFLNHHSAGNSASAEAEGKEIVSMEGIEESVCDGYGAVAAYGQEEGDVLTQEEDVGGPLFDDLGLGGEFDDFFFNFDPPQNNAAATFKGKEIATMDSSGILQYTTAHLGPYQCDENGQLTSINDRRMSSKKGLEPNQWHHGSSSVVNHTQNSFTALGNGLRPTTAEECGEFQVRKKARLQYPTAAPLNNNLPPLFTPADYWETVFTNAGLDPKKKQKELAAWKADLKRRERDIKRREDAVAGAGVPASDKSWPPFFPIIHHDIVNEIPVQSQKMQLLGFCQLVRTHRTQVEIVDLHLLSTIIMHVLNIHDRKCLIQNLSLMSSNAPTVS